MTFEEKGLKELFDDAVKAGIRFTNEYQITDTYIISVPTPYDKFSRVIDPCYVVAAVRSVMKCALKTIVIIESTVSPEQLINIDQLLKKRFYYGEDIHLAHCPERIMPGNMVYELLHNNRTIGADERPIAKKVAKYYSSFCQGQIALTNIKTTEMTKVIENAFKRICFANEPTKIGDKAVGCHEVVRFAMMHPRVNILQPGPSVGRHFISVDPWFLVGDYPQLSKVIGESMKVNESMPEYVLGKIANIMKENGISDPGRVGLYGLTYKENVDDFRESPTLQLLEHQASHLAEPLKVYDPWIKKDIVKNQYHDFDQFLKDVDLVVIMVKHDHIKENFAKLDGKIVFDTCNIYNKKAYKL